MNVNLLDETSQFEWVGFWHPFELTEEWRLFNATAELPVGRSGHILQASIALGGTATTYAFDGIELTQACGNWPTPWLPLPPLYELSTGFEGCEGAYPTFLPGPAAAVADAAAATEAATAVSDLFSPVAARSGSHGARVRIQRELPADREASKRPKLRVGQILLSDARAASDALQLTVYARLQPGPGGMHRAHADPLTEASAEDGGLGGGGGVGGGGTEGGDGPSASLSWEVLDLNQSYAWLGVWQPCNLTTLWTKCSHVLEISPHLASHVLEISLVFGSSIAS